MHPTAMHVLKPAIYGIAFLVILPACGPNMKLVRDYMDHSPHRHVAVLPLDRVPGQKDLSQHAADMMETKMRRLGFIITDRQKVRPLYYQSSSKDHSFNDAKGAAEIGQVLGVQAVLVGIIDEAYERVSKTPAQYEIVTNPVPACCNRPTDPCPSTLVYDPMVQAYVSSCSPTHRRIQISPASTLRLSGFAVRQRLVDVATGNVFWESVAQARPDGLTVYNAADQATDTLSERIIEDFMKRGM
jgi:hypothetical protein